MNDRERLKYIEKELKVLVKELNPDINKLFFIGECLKDLLRVSEGKNSEHI